MFKNVSKFDNPLNSWLQYLAESMNFTYTMVRPPDGKWGVGDSEGNWNGMLGMVKRNEVDFALGPFGVIYEREQEACDFSYPVVIDYWTSIVAVNLEQDPWPIARPFEWEVWVGLICIFPFFTMTLAAMDYIYRGEGRYVRRCCCPFDRIVISSFVLQTRPTLRLHGPQRPDGADELVPERAQLP